MTRSFPRPLPAFTFTAALTLVLAASALASGPADPLLKLVPPDAGLTLAVEDLRGHAREVLASPLAERLGRLPAVQGWKSSENFRGLRRSVARVEALLGDDLAALRDGLLGEAVVLTLRLPPGGAPDSARGMLLVRAPDRDMLRRLVEGVDAAQLKSGALRRVSERRRGGAAYRVREHPPGTKPDEYYAWLDGGGTFAWSNSEELVLGAIDRQAAGAGGLADLPAFQDVRRGLPGRSAASLFVDPRFLERQLAQAPRPSRPQDERFLAMVSGYLAAVPYAGAALEWRGRDGVVVLHTHEAVDPSKLGPNLKHWAARPEPAEPGLRRVPTTALAVASAQVDFVTLLDILQRLTLEPAQPKLDNLRLMLRGLLLGRDPRDAVAPHLGPGTTAYLERPDAEGAPPRPPFVLAVRLAATPEGAKSAEAVDNALRTLLALTALDPKNGGGRFRVDTRDVAGASVVSLGGLSPSPFAYAVHDGRVVLGTSADAVARALAAQAEPGASASGRFGQLRERYFPGASSSLCVDLRALHAFADARRPALARRLAARRNRPEADAARDLDQALALIDQFEAAYLTTAVDPAFTAVHRTLGLIAREPTKP
jgi:hypothetical protein